MNKITIKCDCGKNIKTDINKDYDVTRYGEGGFIKKVECSDCHAKYEVRLWVSIL